MNHYNGLITRLQDKRKMPSKDSSFIDIFGLLSEDKELEKTERKKQREQLLASAGVKELFQEGNLSINRHTCVGVQCKLCIKACPTNALYWRDGEVGITEELCVYCGACVLCCMVDNCVKVTRKRENGTTERFSKPKDVIVLAEKLNEAKRFLRVRAIFPSWEEYCKKYGSKK